MKLVEGYGHDSEDHKSTFGYCQDASLLMINVDMMVMMVFKMTMMKDDVDKL